MKTTKLFSFRINFIVPITVIVSVEDATDARTDAVSALMSKFGTSAHIRADEKGTRIKMIPADAEPIRNTDWAWIVRH